VPPPRVDPWLLVAGAALVGAAAVGSFFPALVVLAAVVVAVALRGVRTFASPAWVAFAAIVAFGSFVRGARLVTADRVAYASLLTKLPRPSRCALRGTVDSMPRLRGVLSADVVATSLACGDVDAKTDPLPRIHLYDLPASVARGDVVDLVVQIAPSRRPREPDLDDPSPIWARRAVVASGSVVAGNVHARGFGVLPTIDRLRAVLRRSLQRSLPPDASSIARALVLGEEDLAPDDDEAFRGAGLTHLLAVSGAHVALVVGGLVTILRALLLRIERLARRVDVARVASAIAVPIALIYEQIAGDSGSARRATAMAVVVLLARAGCRRPDIVRALSLSTLAVMVVDPLAVVDVSFVLSIVATVSLLVIAPPIARFVEQRAPWTPRVVRVALAATLAATVGCTPWIARLGGSVPLLGVGANLVAVPLGELAALPLANVVAVLGALPVPRALMHVFDLAIVGAARLLRGVALVASSPTWSRFVLPPPTSMQLALVMGGALGLALVRRRIERLAFVCIAVAAVLVAEIATLHAGAPRGRLRITVLDVGQGDSVLVDFPDGRAMLVDGGGEVGSSFDPGRSIVAPVLAARRRRRLDVVALTHPHPDHFLGLAAALRDVEVGAFWDTGQGEASGAGDAYAALLAMMRRRGVPVVRPDVLCSGPRAFGGATIEVLHPCPRFDPLLAPNDDSFVIRIAFGRHAALLVGDAEHVAEQRLLAAPDRLHADFLKVGHHGSKTSSTIDFLRAVSPEIAAISCGVRNRFGHPHRSTLETLSLVGARVLRTDVEGAIVWSTDGVTSTFATAGAPW
jgi:competence protein ComEC